MVNILIASHSGEQCVAPTVRACLQYEYGTAAEEVYRIVRAGNKDTVKHACKLYNRLYT